VERLRKGKRDTSQSSEERYSDLLLYLLYGCRTFRVRLAKNSSQLNRRVDARRGGDSAC